MRVRAGRRASVFHELFRLVGQIQPLFFGDQAIPHCCNDEGAEEDVDFLAFLVVADWGYFPAIAETGRGSGVSSPRVSTIRMP